VQVVIAEQFLIVTGQGLEISLMVYFGCVILVMLVLLRQGYLLISQLLLLLTNLSWFLLLRLMYLRSQ
jgi:hypothetical protein